MEKYLQPQSSFRTEISEEAAGNSIVMIFPDLPNFQLLVAIQYNQEQYLVCSRSQENAECVWGNKLVYKLFDQYAIGKGLLYH